MTSPVKDDEYEIPLRGRRYFGAGIKRKRIQFVPASSNNTANFANTPKSSSPSAADKYLSIVLKRDESLKLDSQFTRSGESTTSLDAAKGEVAQAEADAPERQATAELAGQVDQRKTSRRSPSTGSSTSPLRETSIVHQIRQSHSLPPSHIDRRRLGLSVLASHGWDPDGRKGLGAEGEGMLHPIKARSNPQRAGIGVRPQDLDRLERKKPVKLDAKSIQRLDKASRQKAIELRDEFYRSESLDKYLRAETAETVGESAKDRLLVDRGRSRSPRDLTSRPPD